MPYVYIGRKNGFIGKTLWEILGNLKDFGKGRMVVRSKHERIYKEPCYYRIVHAQPLMDEKNLYGRVLVEEVFRGRKNPELKDLTAITYKNDFKLVPKHEEHKLINVAPVELPETVVPSEIEPPPLLKMLCAQRRAARGEDTENISMEMIIRETTFTSRVRRAKSGEQPTIPINLNPSKLNPSSRLYQGIQDTNPQS
ncbi:small ribosomal subunit protein mS34-like [Artemia franciscana]|uniref:28S ribosomal protein S34, mitochondrial n=1 Tax=Artemia franciscana TaxID=6661 RepID=A0AA88KZK0_ARTSF|nr:hypothetical protein QYM36_012113 [Artemia franciscana]KAK2710818.1 hypothetical protein QYM36_012113 [Artemia franciscana]